MANCEKIGHLHGELCFHYLYIAYNKKHLQTLGSKAFHIRFSGENNHTMMNNSQKF